MTTGFAAALFVVSVSTLHRRYETRYGECLTRLPDGHLKADVDSQRRSGGSDRRQCKLTGQRKAPLETGCQQTTGTTSDEYVDKPSHLRLWQPFGEAQSRLGRSQG